MNNCTTCRYGHRPAPDQDWRCRRNPPSASHDHLEFHNRFPAVAPGDWCGRYKSKVSTTTRNYRAEVIMYRDEMNACYREAAKLATYIVRTHYPDNRDWKPLDTLAGVLSQIDNAVTRWADDVAYFEKEKDRWMRHNQQS